MVVQFVGFVGAYRAPGGLDPWLAGVLGGLLTTWVTFVPSFVLVLLGAPYVERLRSNRALSSALTGVTAAVVGVIANLALFFAVHTLFARVDVLALGPLMLQVPQLGTLQWPALAVTALALALVFVARWSVLRTLGVCAVVGMGLQVLLTALAQ